MAYCFLPFFLKKLKNKEGVVNKSYFGTLESAGSNPVPARVAQLEKHSAFDLLLFTLLF